MLFTSPIISIQSFIEAVVIVALIIFAGIVAIILISSAISRAKWNEAQEREARHREDVTKRWVREFRVPFPTSVGEVTFDPNENAVTAFNLEIPHWEHAKSDGTKDERRGPTAYYFKRSSFVSGPWKVMSGSPLKVVGLVRQLRKAGIEVTPHRWESEKGLEEAEVTRFTDPIRSARELVQTYRHDSYGFERFCVGLYRKLGYTGETTRKSADGGYDFIVEKDGEKTVGECKLYGRSTTVGRPDLQKLYGANAIVGADHMVFITTNTFTPEARKYAEGAGIEIIDGEGIRSLQYRAKAACAGKDDGEPILWRPLTEQDIIDRTPSDLRDILIRGIA